jgi:hypothetical protein
MHVIVSQGSALYKVGRLNKEKYTKVISSIYIVNTG